MSINRQVADVLGFARALCHSCSTLLSSCKSSLRPYVMNGLWFSGPQSTRRTFQDYQRTSTAINLFESHNTLVK